MQNKKQDCVPPRGQNARSTCMYVLKHYYFLIILRACQYDDGYIDGRSQIKVHTVNGH